MDKTKEYIKMCQKAEEVQQQRVFVNDCKDGDFFARKIDLLDDKKKLPKCFDMVQDEFPNSFIVYVRTAFGYVNDDYGDNTNEIWLPRQDQLQELLGNNKTYRLELGHYPEYPIKGVNDFRQYAVLNRSGACWIREDTMEKVLLKLLMQEQHFMNWNGEEWK